MIDPFKDGYSMVELTEAINVLPNMYGRVNELGLFKAKSTTTAAAMIEMKNGVLTLVPTVPYGAPASKNKSGRRNIRTFTIPHTPLEDIVRASEVSGVRAFGSQNTAETVNGVVSDKMQEMKNKIDQTMEWRKMGALKGQVLDADGTTVLEDYFASFGVTQYVVDFDLSNTATNVRAKTLDVARHIEDNLMGEMMQRIHVLASPEWFDGFISHGSVEKAFVNYAEAAGKIGGDPRKGFSFGAFTIEEYRGVVDGHRFIAAGEAHAFPIGTNDTFSNYSAPADFIETVNTLGLPFYARQQNTDFNRGVDIHVQANQLPLVTRPAVLVKLSAAG